VYAGKVASGVGPITSDIVAIIGIGGDRVGYVIIAAGEATARKVAQQMLMLDEPSEEAMRDAIGEMTNNIAGLFKNRFQEQYGNVALGLPLVVSGFVRPPADQRSAEPNSSVSMQFKGVTIPFKTMDDSISFRVMVLI
jgi:CheY-specific phosphatase CheX